MKLLLNLTVFITGACALILELLFMRILAPYFGNTIYTTSGTITVVLTALSIGYKIGGSLADKKPSYVWFFGTIVLAGIILAISFPIISLALPTLSANLPLDSGPLVTSLLFLLPANILFGMVSPFAIKLQTDKLNASGSTAGSLFFWSTLGSITGSLLTTFYLIPKLGIDTSFRLTYLLTLGIGSIGLVMTNYQKTAKVIGVTSIFIFLFSSNISTFQAPINSHIFEGLYEKIIIRDIQYKNRPVRLLMQNTNASAAIYLDSPELLYDYSKPIVLTDTFVSNPKSALSLGAGAYTIPKWLANHYPDMPIDVIEIEPILEPLSKEYFSLPNNKLITTYIDDGRRFLLHSTKLYDIAFVDMYSSRMAVPNHVVTREFFSLLKNHLSPQSVVMFNFIGNLDQSKNSPLLPILATLQSQFPYTYLLGTTDTKLTTLQNIIIISSAKPVKPASQLWNTFASKNIPLSKLPLSTSQILTDDKNPIDLLYAHSF